MSRGAIMLVGTVTVFAVVVGGLVIVIESIYRSGCSPMRRTRW